MARKAWWLGLGSIGDFAGEVREAGGVIGSNVALFIFGGRHVLIDAPISAFEFGEPQILEFGVGFGKLKGRRAHQFGDWRLFRCIAGFLSAETTQLTPSRDLLSYGEKQFMGLAIKGTMEGVQGHAVLPDG
jgi:hypothetical protein